MVSESTSPISTLLKEVVIRLMISIILRPTRSAIAPPRSWPAKLEIKYRPKSTPTSVMPTPNRLVM